MLGPRVKRHTRIGGSVVVTPGPAIGGNCLITSGPAWTREIAPNTVATGDPAGERIRIERLRGFKGRCPRAHAQDPRELFEPYPIPDNEE